MSNLFSAYRLARRAAFGTYYRPGDSASRPFDSRFARPLPASDALARARDNLAAFRDARAEYEDSAVARDHASPDARAEAERRHEKARAEVARLRARCEDCGPSDYGAGTWQGGDESAPAAALPFAMPPAMRNGRHGWKPYGRAMTAGDKGGQFFAMYEAGAVRNIRDAGELARLNHTGYYDNPHGESFRDGSGLIVGVVGQLRGRNGWAVFVPGWRLGDDCQGGATFDMRAAVVAAGREESDAEEAAERAARIADGMAETAAEAEREYKTAWGAGAAWADAGERLAAIRAEVREILAERRGAARTGASWPALCKAIRARVDSLLADRAEAMAERARLAEGDESPFVFYPDAAARAAFCEGAGVEAFPA